MSEPIPLMSLPVYGQEPELLVTAVIGDRQPVVARASRESREWSPDEWTARVHSLALPDGPVSGDIVLVGATLYPLDDLLSRTREWVGRL